jgi:hypothetical protein
VGKGLTAVRGAFLCLLVVPTTAEAVRRFTVIVPRPGRPEQFYLVPQNIIRPHLRSPAAVRDKLQGPSGSLWGPRRVTATPRTDGRQWRIFPVCNDEVTSPGKLVEPTDPNAILICP